MTEMTVTSWSWAREENEFIERQKHIYSYRKIPASVEKLVERCENISDPLTNNCTQILITQISSSQLFEIF